MTDRTSTDPSGLDHPSAEGVRAVLRDAAAGPVPAADFESLYLRARRRRLMRRTSAVAAAVLLAATAVTVPAVLGFAHGRGDSPLPLSTTSPTPNRLDLSGVVPWIGAPAPPYVPLTAPALPKPASDARPCSSNDVAARWDGGDGGGGHSIEWVRLRNTSRTTCVLKGYPSVTATQPGLPAVTGTHDAFFPPGGPVANMAPGKETLLNLETWTWCAANPGGGPTGHVYHHFHIALPGGGTVTLANAFDLTCGLHETRFWVQQPTQPDPHDPLSDLRASLEVPATAEGGTTLTYVADLTNPTAAAIRLDRCPGYVQATYGIKQLYALNCAAVGSIPAHRSVRFEMRMPMPSGVRGPLTITWGLAGPWPGVFATATLEIVPAPGVAATTVPTVNWTPSKPTTTSSPVPSGLVRADWPTPVAGACGADTGPIATVRAMADMPAPRCIEVRGDQRLQVVNDTNSFGFTGQPITVRFANFPEQVLPVGASITFDKPMGTYLAPGVHALNISFYDGGAEVYLR